MVSWRSTRALWPHVWNISSSNSARGAATAKIAKSSQIAKTARGAATVPSLDQLPPMDILLVAHQFVDLVVQPHQPAPHLQHLLAFLGARFFDHAASRNLDLCAEPQDALSVRS